MNRGRFSSSFSAKIRLKSNIKDSKIKLTKSSKFFDTFSGDGIVCVIC